MGPGGGSCWPTRWSATGLPTTSTGRSATTRTRFAISSPGTTSTAEWIVEHITYDAYGTVAARTGTVDCLFSSTGRLFDESTGLRRHDRRWYPTPTGRWLNEDLIGHRGDLANVYRYCGGDPVNAADPTGLGYREDFIAATPNMPSDWPVHHTLQQAKRVQERFKEAGIDVDDLDYLRGVDPKLHDQINQCQTDFWKAMMDKYDCDTLAEVYEKVSLDDVLAHVKAMEEQYGHLWLRTGGTAEDVAKIRKALQSVDLSKEAKKLASAKVLKRAGIILGSIAIVGDILDYGALAKGIIAPSAAQQRAFAKLVDQYAIALGEKRRHNFVSKKRLVFVHEALQRYHDAVNTPDMTKGLSMREIEAAISKH